MRVPLPAALTTEGTPRPNRDPPIPATRTSDGQANPLRAVPSLPPLSRGITVSDVRAPSFW